MIVKKDYFLCLSISCLDCNLSANCERCPEPNAASSNCLFSPNNSPKPKESQRSNKSRFIFYQVTDGLFVSAPILGMLIANKLFCLVLSPTLYNLVRRKSLQQKHWEMWRTFNGPSLQKSGSELTAWSVCAVQWHVLVWLNLLCVIPIKT